MSVEVSPEFDSTTWLEPFCVVSAFSPHAWVPASSHNVSEWQPV